MKNIYFIIPDFGESLTGGTIYDDQVIRALKKSHLSIKDIRVSPKVSSITLLRKIQLIPKHNTIILDGFLANKLKKRVINNLKILVHHPCSLEISNNQMKNIGLYFSERRAFNMADSLITVSKHMKSVLLKYLDSQKNICVAYPGIDDEYYNVKPDSTSNNILSIGNIIPRKGYHFLIKALSEVNYDWNLNIIGDHNLDINYFNHLKRIISEHKLENKIKFLGVLEKDSVIKEMKRSRIFMLLTQYEGFGMSIVESASAGLEVITSDLPVLREVLKNSNAEFVDAANTCQISNLVESKLHRKNTPQEFSEKKFRWDSTSRIIKAIL